MVHRTQKLSAVLILILVALTLSACGGKSKDSEPVAAAQSEAPAAEVPAGDAANGKTLFATSCVACHGPAGEGVAGLGKDMTTSDFIAGLSDTELVEFIKKGRDPGDPLNTTGVLMPPKGGNPALTDAQLMDIVAFMRTIHK
jgi:mono/diheme cytochrome c family protein